MKCIIPEISWHNREPVLSVDLQHSSKDGITRLATGGSDTHVVIWKVSIEDTGIPNIEFLADLTRHQKSVNAVRFSPNGELLASADDEAALLIWNRRSEREAPDLFQKEDDVQNIENWQILKILRGHIEDIYDLAWSPDSQCLISGSVDNSAVVWDILKGSKVAILAEHKGFVQGVAWDPKGQYLATLSSDRNLRIYNLQTKRVLYRISKASLHLPQTGEETTQVRLFYDDTLQSFCRRLCFTPDGELLITPAGLLEIPGSVVGDKSGEEGVGAPQKQEKPTRINSTYVFSRQNLTKPAIYLPCHESCTVAVRCCPLYFSLRGKNTKKPAIGLPYRIVYAVATASSVILYDTEQLTPFAKVGNLHYTRLSDLTWSEDGRILVVSSTDGYCSVVTFAEGELGDIYQPDKTQTQESTPQTQESGSDFNPSTQPSTQSLVSDIEPLPPTQEEDVICLTDSPVRETNPEVKPTTPSSARIGRRVKLVTLSSPKSKKKLNTE